MRISALGSGSKGNSTLIQAGAATLMVDCGFGLKESIRRLETLGINPGQIDAILVTHEHQDHISGVEPFAAKFGTKVFMTAGTARVWKSRGRVIPEFIRCGELFVIKEIEVLPVAVPHDAREPVQFVVRYLDHKIGILTDLGSLTKHIYEAYKDCQALLIEANHDLQMLQSGSYPASLKRRVAGDWGHLNNTQTASFLTKILSYGKLKQVVIGHISEKNNRVELVKEELQSHLPLVEKIAFATQGETLDWIDL